MAKPRRKSVIKASKQPQGVEPLLKPQAYSTDVTRGGWRRHGEAGQGASPG